MVPAVVRFLRFIPLVFERPSERRRTSAWNFGLEHRSLFGLRFGREMVPVDNRSFMAAAADDFEIVAAFDSKDEPAAPDFDQGDLGGYGHAERSWGAVAHIDMRAYGLLGLSEIWPERYNAGLFHERDHECRREDRRHAFKCHKFFRDFRHGEATGDG
jgi:hypothetical protein